MRTLNVQFADRSHISLPAPPQVELGAWTAESACLNQWEMFNGENIIAINSAKEMCAECPVFDECRAYVDELEGSLPKLQWWNVWAGETPQERAIRRGR